jgi:two-component system OmpR family sensor kinase
MLSLLWRLRWPIAITLAPITVAGVVGVAIMADRIIDVRIEVAGPLHEWAPLIGGGIAVLVAGGFALWEWEALHHHRAIVKLQTRQADDRRDFLGRLDHELKNPLTVIGGGLENLAAAPECARQESLPAMKAQIERLRRLMAGLRKLTDLETQPLDLDSVQLADLLLQAVAGARKHPSGEPNRPALSLPLALPLPVIIGDEYLLLLAIHNLLDNALKFTRPDDQIQVRAFADGQRVLTEIHDTGPGIPADEIPHVWEELYRGQDARGTPGSGLGLTLVRAIVLRHGGQVSLESEVGRGTIVRMWLPVGGSAER